jgi:hypothetical protein
VVASVTIGSSQRIIFKNFNINWPNELIASVGTIASIDKHLTITVRVEPQYHVNAHIVALSLWDAKSDPKNPHLALKNYQEQYANNQGAVYLGNNTLSNPVLESQIYPEWRQIENVELLTSRSKQLPEIAM